MCAARRPRSRRPKARTSMNRSCDIARSSSRSGPPRTGRVCSKTWTGTIEQKSTRSPDQSYGPQDAIGSPFPRTGGCTRSCGARRRPSARSRGRTFATKPYKLLFDSPLVLNPVAALEATARGGVTLAKIKIENVVASTSLGEELDLQAIALALGGAEYEPEQFPGLIYRLKEPKTATLLFRSGKVVCTGAKSLEHVKTAIDMVAKQIEAAGIPIKKNPVIEVQNIVASSDLGTEINLNAIAISLGCEKVESEPEQFPGLVYRIDVPKVVVLLFGSGKLVCTGARKPSDVEEAVEKITQELKAAGLLR